MIGKKKIEHNDSIRLMLLVFLSVQSQFSILCVVQKTRGNNLSPANPRHRLEST
jgi:hypothetical protein